ncbi:MAG: ABC transporter permease [Terriglobales bacterium]
MRWLGMLWRRGRSEQEAAREIRAHLGLMAADLEQGGMDAAAARRQAAILLGGEEQTRAQHRGARGLAAIEDWAREARHAGRSLRRARTFTLAAVATLGIGIGATTAIYSVVQSVLLDPLHFPQPQQLLSLRLTAPGNAMAAVSGSLPFSSSLYVTASEHNRSFSSMGIWVPDSSVVTGEGGPEQVRTVLVSDGVLQALGTAPRLGRWLNASDQTPHADGAVMLSYAFWQKQYGGANDLAGRKLMLDNVARPIAGVMPAGFRLASADFDLLVPLAIDRSKLILAGFSYYGVGRLKPEVGVAAADREMGQLIGRWMDSWTNGPGSDPHFYERWRITPAFEPLKQQVVGGLAPALWAVLGTVGLVLLMACVNVMNLFLARAESRRRELAVRVALGAGAGRIVRSVLVESAWLAAAGGTVGLGVAYGALRLMEALVPASLARLGEVQLDWRSALACGLAPALQYSRRMGSLTAASSERTGTASAKQRRRRDLLIAAQVALALVLLFSAGLLLRSFAALQSVELGFRSPPTLQTFALLNRAGRNAQAVLAGEHAIADRIAATPGVQAVSFASDVPMLEEGHDWDEIYTEGATLQPAGALPMRLYEHIAPAYFSAMGIPLLAGRELTWADIQQNRPVVLVSAALARELWGSPQAALGKRLREFPHQPWFEIIGVAGDVRADGPRKPATATVYWPPEPANGTQSLDYAIYVVRSERAGSRALVRDLTEAVHAVNANWPLAKPRTMEALAARSLAVSSFAMVMLALAGGMALLLGIVGIYGVVAYDVARRRREIGIRLALGSRPRAVQGLFVRQALQVALIGAGVGGLAAVPVTASLGSLLYGVRPLDAPTLAGALGLMVAAVAAAAYFPALRGSSVSPAEVLAAE